MDGACACLAGCVVLFSARWSKERSIRNALALVAFIALGLFTKVSCLPLAVLPAVATTLSQRRLSRSTLKDLVLFSALPGLLVLIYLISLGSSGAVNRDMAHLASTWNLSGKQLTHFFIEMALLFQALPLLALCKSKATSTEFGKLVLAAAILLTVSTWTFGLPAIPRLYLPTLLLIVPLAAGWLAALKPRTQASTLALYLAANYTVALVGLAT